MSDSVYVAGVDVGGHGAPPFFTFLAAPPFHQFNLLPRIVEARH